METNFNTKDIFIGFNWPMYFDKEKGIFTDLFFDFRPYKRTAFFQEDTHTYYQLKEERFVFGVSAEWIKDVAENYGVFVLGGIGYTFGDFAGTEMFKAEEYWTPVISAGLCYKAGFLYIKCGYEYIKIPNVPPNRGIIGLRLVW
jgi:hypothetical protein